MNTLISGLIGYYLPIKNEMIKLQLGLLINTMLNTLINNNYYTKIVNYLFSRKNNHVVIESLYEDRKNPIYQKFENYIMDNFSKKITSSILVPKEGSISLLVNNNSFKDKIIDNFESNKIEILFNEQTPGKDDKKELIKKQKIIIESKTASQETLKKYVISICKLEKAVNKTLTIWRPLSQIRNKEEDISWECTKCKTNKSFENTIVSDDVEKNLFNDIDWFINSDDWYSNKGLPYKRGYLLYGPPGTGKTSIIKAIANHYNLNIFTIDFETIKTNNDLINMIIEINVLAQNKRYILSLEDIDRSAIWKERYYREDCKITKDCLLNVIDGIIESYGRILIMTCNDPSFIKRYPAIHRPGRIDQCVKIDYCDVAQVTKLINKFYDINIERTPVIKDQITPAQFIKIMQQHPDSSEFILKHIEDITPNLLDNSLDNNISNKSLVNFIQGNSKKTSNVNTINNLKRDIRHYNKQITRLNKVIVRNENSIERWKNKTIPNLKEKLVKKQEIEKKNKQKERERNREIKKLTKEKEKTKKYYEEKLGKSQIVTRSMEKKIM